MNCPHDTILNGILYMINNMTKHHLQLQIAKMVLNTLSASNIKKI